MRPRRATGDARTVDPRRAPPDLWRMELTYLIVLLCALVAMNWRFLGFDRLVASKPQCRWTLDAEPRDDGLQRFVCQRCGSDAHTADGRPPNRCQRRGAG